jgi:thymidine kinase
MSINLVVGCMYSGKSSELIKTYGDLKDTNNVCVITYSGENRYGVTGLYNHDNDMIDCIKIKNLYDLDNISDYDTFLIDEAQFFSDLYTFVLELCETHNKNVYVYGLDGDSDRTTFGEIYKLYSVCDSIKKLYATCFDCKKDNACFSYRLSEKKEQILISNDYIPLCRKCYINKYIK